MLILVVFKSLAEQKIFLSLAKIVGMKVASGASFNIEHFCSIPSSAYSAESMDNG